MLEAARRPTVDGGGSQRSSHGFLPALVSVIQVSRIWRLTQRLPVRAVSGKSGAGGLAAGRVEAFHFQHPKVHRGAILSEIRAAGAPPGVLVATTKPEAASLTSACAIAKTLRLCINRAKL